MLLDLVGIGIHGIDPLQIANFRFVVNRREGIEPCLIVCPADIGRLFRRRVFSRGIGGRTRSRRVEKCERVQHSRAASAGRVLHFVIARHDAQGSRDRIVSDHFMDEIVGRTMREDDVDAILESFARHSGRSMMGVEHDGDLAVATLAFHEGDEALAGVMQRPGTEFLGQTDSMQEIVTIDEESACHGCVPPKGPSGPGLFLFAVSRILFVVGLRSSRNSVVLTEPSAQIDKPAPRRTERPRRPFAWSLIIHRLVADGTLDAAHHNHSLDFDGFDAGFDSAGFDSDFDSLFDSVAVGGASAFAPALYDSLR